jgi:hypothetical protein
MKGIVEKLFCFSSLDRIFKDGRIFSVQFPGMEKESPVDIIAQFLQGIIMEILIPGEKGFPDPDPGPVGPEPVLPRFFQGKIALL